MQKLVDFLNAHEDLSEYRLLASKAAEHVESSPDISIECSKSLVEGLTKKNISKASNRQLTDKDFRDQNMAGLIKSMFKAIEDIEMPISWDDSIAQRCASLAHALGTLRNDRGDISHGKLYPKECYSSKELARLVLCISEGMGRYLVDIYDYIPKSIIGDKIDYLDGTLRDGSYSLESDTNKVQAFNTWLDDKNPMTGKLRYSQALHEQDYDSYALEYEEYLMQIEEEG